MGRSVQCRAVARERLVAITKIKLEDCLDKLRMEIDPQLTTRLSNQFFLISSELGDCSVILGLLSKDIFVRSFV